MFLTMGISKVLHHFSEASLFLPRKEMCVVINSDFTSVIKPEDFMLESFNAQCILAKYSEYLL